MRPLEFFYDGNAGLPLSGKVLYIVRREGHQIRAQPPLQKCLMCLPANITGANSMVLRWIGRCPWFNGASILSRYQVVQIPAPSGASVLTATTRWPMNTASKLGNLVKK